MTRHEYTGYGTPEYEHTLPDPTTQAVEQTGQLSFDQLSPDGGSEEIEEVSFTPLVIVEVPADKREKYNEALAAGRRAIAEDQEGKDIPPEHSLSHVGQGIEIPDTDEWRLAPDEVDSMLTQVKTLKRMVRKELSDEASKHAQRLSSLRTRLEDAFAETWERLLVAIEENPDIALKFTHDKIDPSYVRYHDEFDKAISLSPHEGDYLLLWDDRRNLYRFWLAQAFAYKTCKSCVVIPAEDAPEDGKLSPSRDDTDSESDDEDESADEDVEMSATSTAQQATLPVNS